MNSTNIHDQSSSRYDQQAAEWDWNPDVIFGLMFEYIISGQKLLDLGIGTGLCSELFAKTGLEIYGMDNSEKMLKICKSKEFAIELKKHDLQKLPWPYSDDFFHHIICGGVFHFFGDLSLFISEVARLIKPGGVLGFTVSPIKSDTERCQLDIKNGFNKKLDESSNVNIFFHDDEYVQKLLEKTGFDILKTLVFIASINPDTGVEHHCKLYVAQVSLR